jgi:hypothetical protein
MDQPQSVFIDLCANGNKGGKMSLMTIVDKFLLGFFGGLGWLVINLIWNLIFKR